MCQVPQPLPIGYSLSVLSCLGLSVISLNAAWVLLTILRKELRIWRPEWRSCSTETADADLRITSEKEITTAKGEWSR